MAIMTAFKYNPITGEELTGNEPRFKRMCLNCSFYDMASNVCTNKDNAAAMVEKIKASVSGYEVKSIELSPLPLKNVTKKCGNWDFSMETIGSYIKEVSTEDAENKMGES